VLDKEARTIRVHFLDGRRRHRFGPFDADGRLVSADELTAWRPVDVAAIDGGAFVLDEKHQIVYAHRADAGVLRRVFKGPDNHPRRWVRMAADRDGCLLLWDGGNVVDRADGSGRLVGTVSAARVGEAFRRRAEPLCMPAPPVVTRDGLSESARHAEWPELSFHRSGIWVSEWLDSGIYNCQWDRVVLTLDALPPGSSAILRTRTTASAAANPTGIDLASAIGPAASWQAGATVSADPQPPVPPGPLAPVEFLVQSRPGQFLQLQIELAGNGLSTPVIRQARLTAPRESWLQYLPATFSQPDDQRDFLERYLAIAEFTWSRLETELASFDRFLDPRSVPADQLAYLASWLDLTLEGTLTPKANRQILAALPKLWRTWGTVSGLRAWVQVHLATFTGLPLADIEHAGVPGIIEAFVERRQLWLNRCDSSKLGPTDALWSPAVERRFQVGVFDQLDDVELVSAGDPDLDVFRRHAHRFRVYVPAGWVRTGQAEAVLRRAIDLQRPAHATFDLVLVEPRFRIGDQSTVALDTVVGGAPSWALQCTNETGDAPRGSDRLGYDTVVRGRRRTSGPGAVLGSGGIS
jgi:phage tail-like protein